MPDIAKATQYLAERISPGGSYEALLRFPRFIEIETVHACNARCTMCTINDWERGKRPMDDNLFVRLAEEIIENAEEIKRVSLFRDGEPLLDPKLAERIEILKQGDVRDISISTNISLLTGEKSREILEAGLDLIIMSIDSLDKTVYEGIRIGLKFEEVLENALRFIELRNKINPRTKIWIRMVMQEANKDEWAEYKTYWAQRLLPDHDRIYYHTIFNWGGQLKAFKPVAKSCELNLPCVSLWSLMVIFNNGDVPLCNVDFNLKYRLGNVKDSSIAELWHSKLMETRREKHLFGRKRDIGICGNCNVWDEPIDLKNVSSKYAEADDVA